MSADPTLLGPPELKIASPDMVNFGDPLSGLLSASAGPGGGGGIGTGDRAAASAAAPAAVWDLGSGGGTGGGVFRPGTGGVGYPSCLYCPEPQYSEDARKAKYQGTVVLQAVITPDGRATNIEVVKGPGLGLEEKAARVGAQLALQGGRGTERPAGGDGDAAGNYLPPAVNDCAPGDVPSAYTPRLQVGSCLWSNLLR